MTPAEALVEGRAIVARHRPSDVVAVPNDFYFALFHSGVPEGHDIQHSVQVHWLMMQLGFLEDYLVNYMTATLVGEPLVVMTDSAKMFLGT